MSRENEVGGKLATKTKSYQDRKSSSIWGYGGV